MVFLSADKIYTLFLEFKKKSELLNRFHIWVRENFLTSYLYNLLLHRKFVRFFPYKVIIDASTICNLRCVLCPTGQSKKGLTKGFLTLSRFKTLIDEIHPYIKYVHLSNKGEIFLNPEIFQIIKYAKAKRMLVEADTNLNYFNKDMAEKLVESKMDYLTISIDGASQKTYSIYRRGGNFNRVIRYIKLINKIKEKHGSKKPFLIWQFIVFGHNEHEFKKAEYLAKKLNLEFKIAPNEWDSSYSIPKNEQLWKFLKTKKGYSNRCLQLWYSPVINWNGNMLGCCTQFNEDKHFGNVFEKRFFKVFYGKKMNSARKFVDYFLKGKKVHVSAGIPCAYCIKLKDMYNSTKQY